MNQGIFLTINFLNELDRYDIMSFLLKALECDMYG